MITMMGHKDTTHFGNLGLPYYLPIVLQMTHIQWTFGLILGALITIPIEQSTPCIHNSMRCCVFKPGKFLDISDSTKRQLQREGNAQTH